MIDLIKNYFDMEISNKVYLHKNKIVVSLNNKKAIITTTKLH